MKFEPQEVIFLVRYLCQLLDDDYFIVQSHFSQSYFQKSNKEFAFAVEVKI